MRARMAALRVALGSIIQPPPFVVDVEENIECHVDMGRARAVELPEAETQRRWRQTTPQWPMMHVILQGITRDQFMARHRANHVSVACAPDAERADQLLAARAALFASVGIQVPPLRRVAGGREVPLYLRAHRPPLVCSQPPGPSGLHRRTRC